MWYMDARIALNTWSAFTPIRLVFKGQRQLSDTALDNRNKKSNAFNVRVFVQ